jgi:hypothetical protein
LPAEYKAGKAGQLGAIALSRNQSSPLCKRMISRAGAQHSFDFPAHRPQASSLALRRASSKMDMLLSLPLVSYFFAPTITSWSTSLNLLFFYMTWSTLVLSHGPLKIELVGTLAIRVVFWLAPSLLFLALDTLLPSLAESIKYRGSAALPPRDAALLGRTLLLALFNLALETGLEAGLATGLATITKQPSIFKTSTTFPLPWQMVKHVVFLFSMREVLTYYIHRFLLHQPPSTTSSRTASKLKIKGKGTQKVDQNMRWLAAQHKSFSHSRPGAPPFALMLAADHPLAFLLHRFVPIYLPALLLRPRLHLLTYFIFVLLTTIEETLSMSGYSIVPGILLGGVARRTALHYASGGRGNYGAWGVLDWISGTGVGKDIVQDVKDEAEKHRIKERGFDAMDDAQGLLADGVDALKKRSKRRTRQTIADSDDE